MKVIITNVNEFKKAVATASKAAATKTTLPALECVKITATDDNKVIVTGYDLVTGITIVIDNGVSVKEIGDVLVNAKTFLGLVKKCPLKNAITLETDGNKVLKLSRNGMEFNLPTQDAQTYPKIPKIESDTSFKVKFGEIKKSIEKTLFAAGDDNEQSMQKGSCFTLDVSGGKMKAFALDGFRIAKRTTELEDDNVSFKAKIPKAILSELVKNTAGEDEEMTVSYDNRNIIFDIGNCRMHGRLYGGNIFNTDMIKISGNKIIEVNTADLIDAVDSLMPLVTTIEKTLIATFGKEKITFSLTTTLGTAKTTVAIKNVNNNDEEIQMGFNIGFFLDAVNAAESENIRIILDNALSAVKFYDGEQSEFVVLPVRIK